MEAQFLPFRPWLKANGISVTTGYRLVKEGVLKLTKIRSRSYLTKAESERFEAFLEQKGRAA
jgi:predicted site-specific integrase-resolvase